MNTVTQTATKAIRSFLGTKLKGEDLGFFISNAPDSLYANTIDVYTADHQLKHGDNLCEVRIDGTDVYISELVDYGRTTSEIKIDLNNPNSLDQIANKVKELHERRRI